jgi:hypothetical protein
MLLPAVRHAGQQEKLKVVIVIVVEEVVVVQVVIESVNPDRCTLLHVLPAEMRHKCLSSHLAKNLSIALHAIKHKVLDVVVEEVVVVDKY